METTCIIKTIKRLIEDGAEKFVIYPYGQNGKIVKEILNNKFHRSPVYVVDNALCNFADNQIIGVDELARKYKKEYYIIITVENPNINKLMLHQIQRFVEEDHIVNLLECSESGQSVFPDFSAFRLKNLLNQINVESNQISNKKIKIRILNFSQATWNAIHSICASCNEDKEIELLVINCGNMPSILVETMETEEIRYINVEEYDIKSDLPDVLVVSHPYDSFTQINDCRRYCKLIIVATMQLVRYAHNWSTFFEQQTIGFGRFYPDYYLFDSLLYHDLINAGYMSPRIIEMGNAKFDGIYNSICEGAEIPEWEKLKGKKVFLWTTDHGVHDGIITEDVTLDLYGRCIFEYFRNNTDVGLIFRPHKTLVHELIEAGLWTESDIEMLKNYCWKSPNIVYDDSLTYDAAYAKCDAIITDAYCGITCSALPLLKPMLLLYRDNEKISYHKEIEKCSYSAAEWDEIYEFIQCVMQSHDVKSEIRKEIVPKCVKAFDGKNGWRIKEFIKEKYKNMTGDKIEK